MKKHYTCGVIAVVLALLSHQSIAQASIQELFGTAVAQVENERWVVFNEESKLSTDQVSSLLGDALPGSFKQKDNGIVLRSNPTGMSRTVLQQEFKGVPVEFATVYVHTIDGVAKRANGDFAHNLNLSVEPAVSEEQALMLALECIGAGSYYWENPQLEAMKKHATDDADATFFPKGELMISDRDFNPSNGEAYNLTWKFEIHSAEPESRDWVYIDAMTGEIFKELSLNHTESGYVGTAETRYNGVREIMTDSTETGYVLRDYTRGLGIETYDALDSFSVETATDFFDNDNYWDNANDRQNDVAPDAHFASEMLYDYLRDVHGIDSYDGQGSRMISYVHYGENWRNASWNGFWGQYGNANGEPWVNSDVVGHEYAHGFTWATSALLYTRESGAMNESFSDILGEALERYIYGQNDWVATPAPVDTIRDYVTPATYGHPDTYLGENWVTESFDNFGVHSNSGVQNHMFYLLTEGGTGENDNGDAFEVEAIGFEDAMSIMVRSMTTYLFPTATYSDGRQSSLFAAEDLFGACSFEYRQVANAWHAVGVGEPQEIEDFTVLGFKEMEICNVEDEDAVTLSIRHLGCEAIGPVSLEITLLKSNPPQSYKETIELDQVGAGEIFEVTLSESFSFTRSGEHSLTAILSSEGDPNEGNDRSDEVIVHNLRKTELQRFPFYTNFAPRNFRDTIAFTNSQFASINVRNDVGVADGPGLLIEGDRMRFANPINPGEDVFDYNERLGTEMCFCVDATAYDSLGFQFDLRQTYSSDFERTIGIEQPRTSALRVLINGEEIERYTPETNNDDPWATQYLDLSEMTGLEFVLCMETRTIQSLARDNDSIGDRVLLDNIEFTGSLVETSLNDLATLLPVTIFPNPASDQVSVDLESQFGGMSLVSVYDMSGRVVTSVQYPIIVGVNRVTLDVSDFASGVYLVKIRSENEIYSGRLLVD